MLVCLYVISYRPCAHFVCIDTDGEQVYFFPQLYLSCWQMVQVLLSLHILQSLLTCRWVCIEVNYLSHISIIICYTNFVFHEWPTDWLTEQLTDQLTIQLTDWPMTDRSIDRPTNRPIDRPTDRPTDQPTNRLTNWLAYDQLIDWLFDRWINGWIDILLLYLNSNCSLNSVWAL